MWSRAGEVFGRGEALSPFIALTAGLLAWPAGWFLQLPTAQAPSAKLVLFLAPLVPICLKTGFLVGLQRLIAPHLHGRFRDAVLVWATWFALTLFGVGCHTSIVYWLTGIRLSGILTVGWILSWWLEQLVVAGFLSQRKRLRNTTRNAELLATTAAARVNQQEQYEASMNTWLAQSVADLRLELKRFLGTVPPAYQHSEWREWSTELMTFATGPVRSIGHQAHDLRSAYKQEPGVIEPATTTWRQRFSFAIDAEYIAQSFGRYRPVSVIALLVLFPEIFQMITSSASLHSVGAWVVVTWLLASTLALSACTRFRWYRIARPRTQWAVWFLGLGITAATIIPLGALAGTPETLPFTTGLHRVDQALLLFFALLAVNLFVGVAIAYLAKIQLLSAQLSSDGIVTSDESDLIRDRTLTVLDDVASRVHSTIQGKLAALSLMAAEVDAGDRDPESTHNRLIIELQNLIDNDLPSLVDWEPPSISTTADLASGLLLDIATVWQAVVSLRLSTQNVATGLLVPTDLVVSAGRVVAEGISNAVRHGLAQSCAVTITPIQVDQPWLIAAQVSIADDGLGLSANTGTSRASEVRPGIGTALLDRYTGGDWQLTLEPNGATLTAVVRTASAPAELPAADLTIPNWDPVEQ